MNDVLKEGGRTGAVGIRARRWTSALIVGELALTLVPLAGAGFMMRSFLMAYQADIGIDTTPIVTANVSIPDLKYHEPEQRVAFYRQLDGRLNTIGALEAATVASSWPGGGGPNRPFVIEGRQPDAGTQLPATTTVSVGPRYFARSSARSSGAFARAHPGEPGRRQPHRPDRWRRRSRAAP